MKIESMLPAATAPQTKPEKIKQAATQFESLMLGQLLKGMHGADGGWLGTGDDAAGGIAMELAEEHLAQVLSAQGGLGLANMVVKGLERPPAATVPTAPKD